MTYQEQLNTKIFERIDSANQFLLSYHMSPNVKRLYDNNIREEILVVEGIMDKVDNVRADDFFTRYNKNKIDWLKKHIVVEKKSELTYLVKISIIPSEFREELDEIYASDQYNQNAVLTEYICNLLKDHQIPHVKNNLGILKERRVMIDTSDAGTGKTYTTLANMYELNLTPIVICPAVMVSGWVRAMKHFGLTRYFITTWDLFKRGKYVMLKRSKRKRGFTKTNVVLPFIKIELNPEGTLPKYKYTYNFTPEHCLIFDEAHRLKNTKTQNFQSYAQLFSVKNVPNLPHLVLLSATIAESPVKAIPLFMAMRKCNSDKEFWKNLAADYGCDKGGFTGSREHLEKLHRTLRAYGSRMKMKNIDGIPSDQIIPMLYDSDNADFINKLWDLYAEIPNIMRQNKDQQKMMLAQMNEQIANIQMNMITIKEIKEHSEFLVKELQKAKSNNWILAVRTRLLQLIELNKIPILVDLVNDAIEQGYSVAVFLNYTATIKILADILKCRCVFTGDNKGYGFEDREILRLDFQSGKENIIIGTFAAMRESVDLHDEIGNHPRMVFMPFNDSAQAFVQATGRVHRTGKKTPSIQYVVCISDTIEEKVADNLEKKLFNLSYLNDGDLDPTGTYVQVFKPIIEATGAVV